MWAVEFYSFVKRVNSTARPVGQGVLIQNGEIVEPCSMFKPIIRFDLTGYSGYFYKPTDDELPNEEMTVCINRWNYMYIRQFRRFYFITEWTYEAGFWIATGTEDVLASWRDYIRKTNQYVIRSNQAMDGTIMDNMYPATTSVTKNVIPIDFGWSTTFERTHGTYVLGVLGQNDSNMGSTTYYTASAAGIKTVLDYLLSDGVFNDMPEYLLTTQKGRDSSYITEIKEYLNKEYLKYQFNPLQYIVSCMWFPFGGIPISPENCKIGFWNTGVSLGVVQNYVKTFSKNIEVPKHPQQGQRGTYLNVNPYSRYELFLGTMGSSALDSMSLSGVNRVDVDVNIDLVTGMGQAQVKIPGHTAESFILAQLQGQVGIPIPLAQISTDRLGGTATAVQALANTMGSAMSLDIPGTFSSAAAGIANTVNAWMPQVTTQGNQGSAAGLNMPFCLCSEHVAVVDDDNLTRGRPYCKTANLEELGGYMVIGDPDIYLPATNIELDTIKNYMERGIWIQ